MPEIIHMPLMTDTMEEGVITEWFKEVGDTVESMEVIAEIETDKATMDFESPVDGILLYKAPIEDPVPVNALLAVIAEEGEEVDLDAILAAEKEKAAANASEAVAEQAAPPVAEPEPAATPAPSPIVVETSKPVPVAQPISVAASTSSADGRLKASPLAKRLAQENQVDLRQVKGSGDEGRIIKRDIEAYVANRPTQQVAAPAVSVPVAVPASAPKADNKNKFQIADYVPVGEESFEETRVSQMRKVIARRLGESKFQAPHFYLTMTINMDRAITARKSLNEVSPVKISFNDLIIKAAAMALRQHPQVNSSWLGTTIRTNKHIHIGMAVAVEEGLLVPVIRFADQKSLSQLAAETKTMAKKAKSKKLQPAEMSGNTFSISNLGMMDIDEFTAIINPPDACIMAVGKIAKVPAVVDDAIKIRSQMKITLSCDHRVVDGAVGSRFLQTFKLLLEDPVRILV